jgi:diguanylate cyclase (GGDEF)-like protein/putative nucleotidyltransferase with HDIG domain
VIFAGAGLLALSVWLDPQGLRDWQALLILTACGATAHLYPVRSAQLKARYVVANVFVFAAVLLLSPLRLAVFCAVVMLPHTIRNWRPRILDGYAFNSAQTLIAAMAAYGLIAASGGPDLQSGQGLLAISAGALLFTALQALLVGVVISLNSHVPLRKSDTLQPLALLADASLPFMGIVVGALWQAAPWALAAVNVPLLIAYKLIRQVHLVQHSDVEPKTELFTYRYFQGALRDELNRSPWGKRPLSVIFADMDYLRDVNNTWGHLAGDEVLKQLAAILRSHTRPGEVAARFGGEEFVLMLPGVDADEAAYRAEKIRSGVASHAFCIGGGRTISCTISLGVSCTAEVGRDPEALVNKADEALYQAKARGRNRVARAGVSGVAGDEYATDASGEPALPADGQAPLAEAAAAAMPCEQERGQRTALSLAPAPGVAAPAAPRHGPSLKALFSALVLWSVIAGGAVSLGAALVQLSNLPMGLVHVLAGLAVVAELTKVQVYETDGDRQAISISLGTAVSLAAVGIGGFAAAVSTAFAGAVTYRVLAWKRKTPINKQFFNLFNPVVSAAVAAGLFQLLAGDRPDTGTPDLLAGVAAAVAFYLTNAGLVMVMISLQTGRPLTLVWRDSIWFAPAYILLGLIGAYLGAAFHAVGLMGALLFSLPVLVLRYTFTLYARKSHSSIVALRKAKQEVEAANAAQQRTVDQLIVMISRIIDARDNSTYGHSRQVANYAVAIAREMEMAEAEIETLRTAALLHDLGKVGVPEAILKKPARLTPEEYTIIKEHAALGERILAEVEELGRVARAVGEHHERFDGTGYPQGKAGEAISLAGRILAVADTLDSILSDRPYSRARPLDVALAELRRCSGQQFDPRVVAVALRLAETLGPGAFVNSAAVG